jgi:peptidyl-prolyl cis-trans isomerase C
MSFRTSAFGAVAAFVAGFSSLAQAQSPETVVAELNGSAITFGEIAEFQKGIPNAAEMETSAILPRLIEFYIDQKLMIAAAKGRGLEKDPQVQEQLARLEGELVRQAYLRDEISDRVNDDTIRAAYDKSMETYVQDREIRARHILVKTEDEAEALLRELSDGVNFEDLAREKSTGPSGPSGGDLGYFTMGTMVPEFSQAAFALEVGEITPSPVQTDFGWHIIKVEDKRLKARPTFDDMRAQIRNELSDKAVEEVLTELRGRAMITIAPSAAAPEPAP